MHKLPSFEDLTKYFYYNEGHLYWNVDVGRKIKKHQKCTATNGKYGRVTLNKVRYPVHRIIYKIHNHSFDESLYIDHINGDIMDNRIENLRLVTNSENQFNRHRYTLNKSGKIGVHFCECTKKWVASISINGKKIMLGRFLHKSDAINARIDSENELIGNEINY